MQPTARFARPAPNIKAGALPRLATATNEISAPELLPSPSRSDDEVTPTDWAITAVLAMTKHADVSTANNPEINVTTTGRTRQHCGSLTRRVAAMKLTVADNPATIAIRPKKRAKWNPKQRLPCILPENCSGYILAKFELKKM
jgi:hypothetical protein